MRPVYRNAGSWYMITTVTLNASIDKAYYMESSIENGTVMRVKAVHNSAGGKGLNVARAVHLCGEEVLATGLVGGYNGKYLEALLDKDGVSHDFVHIQGETRSCINILDREYGSTEYLEPGFEVDESTAEEAGSTATILTAGFFDFRYSPTPVMVPPVPTPATKTSTLPSVSS